MDLATKSKNTSFLVKLLCIVLSVVFMMGASLMAVRVGESVYYFQNAHSFFETLEKEDKKLSDCYAVRSKLYKDLLYLYQETAFRNDETIDQTLEEQRTDFISSVMETFTAEYTATLESNAETGTTVIYSEDGEYSESTESISIDVSDIDMHYEWTCGYELNCQFNHRDYSYYFDLSDYAETIYLDDSEEVVYEKLNEIYDEFIASGDFQANAVSYYDNYALAEDLRYYVSYDETGEETANIDLETVLGESESESEFLEHYTYAVFIADGQPYYSAAFSGVLDDYVDPSTGKLTIGGASDCMYLLYVDTDYPTETQNTYANVISNFERIKNYNTKREFCFGVAMAVISLMLAIYSFVIAGRRLENGRVKRAWIDYIPTDVHLALSVAASVGVLYAIVLSGEKLFSIVNYDMVVLLSAAMVCLAGLMWYLFLEFMTSLIRVCRSEKKLYQNLFCYIVIKYVFINPILAIKRNIKKALTYKPNNFKKTVINYLIAYAVLNFIFIFIFFIGASASSIVDIVLPMILAVGINITAIVFCIRYAVNLDKIITAAHTRSVPQVDDQKLPNSLKILADSLQYTRQELNAAVTKAVRDERMRTELITNVSHDLKTPLTSIITYVDLLKHCDVKDENAKEYIEVLDEKGNRLKRLIDDLIEASKITSGVITLNPVMLGLNELAAQAVYERQQEFIDSHLQLVFKGDKTLVNCYADGNKTFRILDNLLSNARKYSASGTRVYCDVYETQNFSVFEIKNISAEQLDITPQELTERFVRGDRSRNKEGNGLGLSIADNLCKAQHGKLNLTIDGDMFKAQVMLPKHQ